MSVRKAIVLISAAAVLSTLWAVGIGRSSSRIAHSLSARQGPLATNTLVDQAGSAVLQRAEPAQPPAPPTQTPGFVPSGVMLNATLTEASAAERPEASSTDIVTDRGASGAT